MTKLKHFTKSLNQMADNTYRILRSTLFLSCTTTFCALILFLASGGLTIRGFEAYMIAKELLALGSVTLLLGTIAALVIEDMARKRK